MEKNNLDNIFATPLYRTSNKDWLHIDKKCDEIINKIIKDNSQKKLKPNSYHSHNLWNEPDLIDFTKYILNMSWSFMNTLGYDLTNRTPLLTELWVQEFPKEGGFHDIHIHGNNHVSGFYFLKADKDTSYPLFHEPRPGKLMIDLPLKDKKKMSYGQSKIKYNVEPGTLIMFPSYVPHSYAHYKGKNKFRFVHFNMQAIIGENIVNK